MRAAAMHLCLIDSGHPFLNRCQVMHSVLLKQGYDKGAPVDVHRSGAAEPPSLGICRWFRSPKKKSPFSLKQGLRSDAVRLASEKQRRAVWSVSPHPSPITSNEWGMGGRPEVAIKLKC